MNVALRGRPPVGLRFQPHGSSWLWTFPVTTIVADPAVSEGFEQPKNNNPNIIGKIVLVFSCIFIEIIYGRSNCKSI